MTKISLCPAVAFTADRTPCVERDVFWRWLARVDTTSFEREVSLESTQSRPVFRKMPPRASAEVIHDIRTSPLTNRQLATKWRMHIGSVYKIRNGMRGNGRKSLSHSA